MSPRDMYNMPGAVMDDDGELQYLGSSKTCNVSDFDDLVIDNWTNVILRNIHRKWNTTKSYHWAAKGTKTLWL